MLSRELNTWYVTLKKKKLASVFYNHRPTIFSINLIENINYGDEVNGIKDISRIERI